MHERFMRGRQPDIVFGMSERSGKDNNPLGLSNENICLTGQRPDSTLGCEGAVILLWCGNGLGGGVSSPLRDWTYQDLLHRN